jgi:uncharacterized protein (TIGR00375 family)
MKYVADLHLHSKFSRATSKSLELEEIFKWAKYKGINLVGTSDATHPFWFAQIKEKLEEDGSGFLKLKSAKEKNAPRFVISSEISLIYSKAGRVRKIHLVLLYPSVKSAQAVNQKLTTIGNLYSDGRPILGLDSEQLVQIVWEIEPEIVVVPAHIWTPWFSLFGSNSGFDSLEECFGKFSENIFALETGLSSDPSMNWRLSAIDRLSLVSSSDAHSAPNLMREATVFEMEKPSFAEMVKILKNKDAKRLSTLEFFPEEGKYHFDGHRNCNVVLSPKESLKNNNICPVCKRPLTVGVMQRVEKLADRDEGFTSEKFPSYKSIVPLMEIIAKSIGVEKTSKAVYSQYLDLVTTVGSEFEILLEMPLDKMAIDEKIKQGIELVRSGKIKVEPGYDGVFGKVDIFGGDEAQQNQQATLF